MNSVDGAGGCWVSGMEAVGGFEGWRAVPEVPGRGGRPVAKCGREGVEGVPTALVTAYAGGGDNGLVALELSSAPVLTSWLAGALPTGTPATLSDQRLG